MYLRTCWWNNVFKHVCEAYTIKWTSQGVLFVSFLHPTRSFLNFGAENYYSHHRKNLIKIRYGKYMLIYIYLEYYIHVMHAWIVYCMMRISQAPLYAQRHWNSAPPLNSNMLFKWKDETETHSDSEHTYV